MIKTITRTIRGARMLGRGELKTYMRGYLDQALQGYGYVRNPGPGGGAGMALPMLGAFSAGVAVGTGIGVLIAPASGEETRATLRRRLDEVMNKMRETTRAETKQDGQSTIITDDPEITHGGPMGH